MKKQLKKVGGVETHINQVKLTNFNTYKLLNREGDRREFIIFHLFFMCMKPSFLFIFLSFTLQAQIKGIVKDSITGKPISFAEVFINKTSFVTQTNGQGMFELSTPAMGFADIILFHPEYELFQSSLFLDEKKRYNLTITLYKKTSSFKPLKKPHKDFSSFEKDFLKQKIYKIANPTDIFPHKTSTGWEVSVNKKIAIENEYLGYTITAYLENISWGEQSFFTPKIIKYETLLNKPPETFSQNRNSTFQNSIVHFFLSLLLHKTEENGYKILQKNGSEIKPVLEKSKIDGYYKVFLQGKFLIQQKKQNWEIEIPKELHINRFGLHFVGEPLFINNPPFPKNSFDILPIDYPAEMPIITNEELNPYRESFYVHTDKPYYYQGEPMWFKIYTNYTSPDIKQQLSTTIYAEFISAHKQILFRKTYPLEDGIASGNWILPNTLKTGNYFLRIYTNFNRNFGDSTLFMKQVPVLQMHQKPKVFKKKKQPETLKNILISSSKKEFTKREKIAITIEILDSLSKSANLSISVTDENQVLPIEQETNIIQEYNLSKSSISVGLKELLHPLEQGIHVSGIFTNENGKPQQREFYLIDPTSKASAFTQSDKNGYFEVGGLDFYDTAQFTIQAFKGKKEETNSTGKISLLPSQKAAIFIPQNTLSLLTEEQLQPQRIFSPFEVPKDVILLKEVIIEKTKIQNTLNMKEDQVSTYWNPSNPPNHIIYEKDIKQGFPNILFSLRTIPGLKVDEFTGSATFTRSQYQSINFSRPPLVTIDDVPVYNPKETLLSLTPDRVKMVTVTNRINVLYGAQGAFGVIAIYLKKGTSIDNSPVSKALDYVKIQGYSSVRNFAAPNYEDEKTDKNLPDFRSTLYWNPNVNTDTTGKATISFFAADLATTYRVVIEGVTKDNKPIRGEYYIEVK